MTTDDGYILKLYRIPGPKHSKVEEINKDPKRRVVLLQHGLLDSSDSWTVHYEEKALAFILANLGYDVWIGNNRGNKYSRSHLTLNPNKDKKFWNFSLHEMGTHDLPAIIDFIRAETGRNKISYIGHSQGTAQLFAGASLDPEYFSSRINCFMAFGPVTTLGNVGSHFVGIMARTRLDVILTKLNIFNEFLADTQAVYDFQMFVCKHFKFLCNEMLRMISDLKAKDDDLSRFLIFIGRFPSGTSLRSMYHFGENIRNDQFASLIDKKLYPLEKISGIPISLFVGKDDELATVKDNRILKEILTKSDVLEFYKEYDGMGHLSFFLSVTNEHLNDMLPILDKYSDIN